MSKQLTVFDFGDPGRLGLNLQQRGSVIGPAWATVANNCQLDSANRLALRGGYTNLTGSAALSPDIGSVFEYLKSDGSVEMIYAAAADIYKDETTPTSVKGGLTITSNDWYFQNFNNKVLGFQDGKQPIVYSGTSFATVVASSGVIPTSKNGIALCAYGRVWVLDSDGQTIKYSGLLDETDWGGAGAGQIDMSNIWTRGMDEVTAITAFNGSFIVFGRNHIIVWDDESGSQLGINPTDLAVVDVIEGTGCVSQKSIAIIGESDLLFASRAGVQSLGRVIQEKSNPLKSVSKYVRDLLAEQINGENPQLLNAVYQPENGLYLLSLPSFGVIFVFDVRRAIQDQEGDTVYPCYQWYFTHEVSGSRETFAPKSMCVTQAGRIRMSSPLGYIYQYGGESDDGYSIAYEYRTGWLDLGEQIANRVKMLKRIGLILKVNATVTTNVKWSVDFNEVDSVTQVTTNAKTAAEWGIAEWGIDEFSGGSTTSINKLPARSIGQYFRFAIEANTTGTYAIEQLELFAKIGRIA